MGVGETLLNAIATIGNVADTPRALTWAILSGRNPLEVLNPFDEEAVAKRPTGWDLMKSIGLEDKPGFDWVDIPAVASEMLFDPINALGGIGLAKKLKAAKVAKVNNALRKTRLAEGAMEPAAIAAMKSEGKSAPFILQRFEDPGVPRSQTSKPHGLYTSPADVTSPHADLGGEQFFWRRNPGNNVLDVSDIGPEEITMRRGGYGAGAGVAAVKKVLGQDEFDKLRRMTRNELSQYVSSRFPHVDTTRYYDNQEIMEALGGELARSNKYDAILQLDETPEWTEFVALSEPSVTPITGEPEAMLRRMIAAGTNQESLLEGLAAPASQTVPNPRLATRSLLAALYNTAARQHPTYGE